MTASVLDKIKLLPVSKQQEVEDFINFLADKYLNIDSNLNTLEMQRKNLMGRYKGKIQISEDFNETPIDFKDYI
jgi:hypothetical protein